jgi:hypothetical protein
LTRVCSLIEADRVERQDVTTDPENNLPTS